MERDSIVAGTVSRAASELLREDTAAARAYLRASFLSEAVLTLWHARQEAGLTQAQVAEELGTRQSAIARMEADFSGSMSLHRYVDYCIACGVLPFDIEVGSIDELREYSRANPDAPRRVKAYKAWASTARPTVARPDVEATEVTVEMPDDLFTWGEEERARMHLSRSEFVANLYRRYRDEIEMERRIARYKAAYAKLPVTEEEQALTEASTQLLATLPGIDEDDEPAE